MIQPALSTTTYKDYKDLIVYKKAKENFLVLFNYYSKNPKLSWTERFLIEQLLRAVASVGANLAEGYGRHYKQEYRRFVAIARGSALEVEHWINLLLEIRPQDKEVLENCLVINTEVVKMLTKMMKNLSF